jgi:hypothetical protein
VNKVIGNIHLSPGRSFQSNHRNLYELVPYLRNDGNKHDFSHIIHHFAFEGKLSTYVAERGSKSNYGNICFKVTMSTITGKPKLVVK